MGAFEDKVNELIGQPYDAVDSHCWHLVEELVPFAPKLDVTAKTLTTSVKHFDKELKLHNLNEVANFEDKDIIVLGREDIFFHAGVYYDGGVIHASLEGVIYQQLDIINKIYSSIKGLRL